MAVSRSDGACCKGSRQEDIRRQVLTGGRRGGRGSAAQLGGQLGSPTEVASEQTWPGASPSATALQVLLCPLPGAVQVGGSSGQDSPA